MKIARIICLISVLTLAFPWGGFAQEKKTTPVLSDSTATQKKPPAKKQDAILKGTTRKTQVSSPDSLHPELYRALLRQKDKESKK